MASSKQGKSGKTTSEYLTVKKHFNDLASHIQHNLCKTAAEFYSHSLIHSMDYAYNSSQSEFERASDVVSAILSAIELDAGNYKIFFASLDNLGYSMMTKILTSTFQEFYVHVAANDALYHSARNTQHHKGDVSTTQAFQSGTEDTAIRSSNIRSLQGQCVDAKHSKSFLVDSYSPVNTAPTKQRNNLRNLQLMPDHPGDSISGLSPSQGTCSKLPREVQNGYVMSSMKRDSTRVERASAPVPGSDLGYSDVGLPMSRPSIPSGAVDPFYMGDPLTGQHENILDPKSAPVPANEFMDSPLGSTSEKRLPPRKQIHLNDVHYSDALNNEVQSQDGSVIHQAISDNPASATFSGLRSQRLGHPMHSAKPSAYRPPSQLLYHNRPLHLSDVPLSQCKHFLPSKSKSGYIPSRQNSDKNWYEPQAVSAPVVGSQCVQSSHLSTSSGPSSPKPGQGLLEASPSHGHHPINGLQGSTRANSETNVASDSGYCYLNDSLGFEFSARDHIAPYASHQETSSAHNKHYNTSSVATGDSHFKQNLSLPRAHHRVVSFEPNSLESCGESETNFYKVAAANREKENNGLKNLLERYKQEAKNKDQLVDALEERIKNLSVELHVSREKISSWKKEFDVLIRSSVVDKVCFCSKIMQHHLQLTELETMDFVSDCSELLHYY